MPKYIATLPESAKRKSTSSKPATKTNTKKAKVENRNFVQTKLAFAPN